LWPRPGQTLAAARTHTFAQLATAIDDAFARWDRAHLHEFTLAGRERVGCRRCGRRQPGPVRDRHRLRRPARRSPAAGPATDTDPLSLLDTLASRGTDSITLKTTP
jgi:hypothetical protein